MCVKVAPQNIKIELNLSKEEAKKIHRRMKILNRTNKKHNIPA